MKALAAPGKILLLVGSLLLAATAWWGLAKPSAATFAGWTDAELGVIRSLWIGTLPGVPEDPTNAVADDERAARFGQLLFFDTRLSGNGAIACATCHQPAKRFADQQNFGRAVGQSKRNTPSIVGAAYSPWLYWDGRKDSLWSQALAPLEDPVEHAGNRLAFAHFLSGETAYRMLYLEIFGALPDLSDENRFPANASPLGDAALRTAWDGMLPEDQMLIDRVFTNLGKAIAAYERRLKPGPSRFDRYAEAILAGQAEQAGSLFSDLERRGLDLFIGRGNCIQCHNGPLLTNNVFHNTGIISAPGRVPDKGRVAGVRQVRADPFNCEGLFSDDRSACGELRFARDGADMLGAFRTPSLRNLAQTQPFMHAGQLDSLAEVLDHYNRAPEAMIGHNEAKPLAFSATELLQLEAFLHTLAAPPAGPEGWLRRVSDIGLKSG